MTSPPSNAAADVGTRDHSRTARPVGLAVMAGLLAMVSLAGIAAIVWSPVEALGLTAPRSWTLLLAATSAAGLWSAWTIWRASAWAERAYLAWCAVGLVAALYYQLALAARMLAVAAELVGLAEPPKVPTSAMVAGLALHVAFLALGWWYLRTAMPRAAR